MSVIERRTITNRDEWLGWRKHNLGASEIPACFGVHPFKTLAELVAEKRGVQGLGPDPEDAMIRRGNALEDDAADEVAKLQTTWEISKNTSYFVDPELRLAATPDFVCIDPEREGFGCLQTKVVSPASFRRYWTEEDAPFYAVLQTETEIMLSGASWGAIAPLIVGDHIWDCPRIYPIPRIADAESRIIETAKKFWAAFDAGEEPTIDFERDEKLIALLYPNSAPGKIADLTQDNRIQELLAERELKRWALDDLKKEVAAIETEIKAKLGDAEIAIVQGWRLSLKTQHRKAYSVPASSFRVLRADRITEKAKT